jgi:hypothetical protein
MRQSFYFSTLLFLLLFSGPSLAQLTSTAVESSIKQVAVTYNFGGSENAYRDKPCLYKDEKTQLLHAVWTEFDSYKSRSKKDSSKIFYAQSPDDGKTWQKLKNISHYNGNCLDDDSTVKGPACCTGIHNELYVMWASAKGLAFQRSTNNGSTWLTEEKIITPIKNGWSYRINGSKANGLPNIACDIYSSEHNGRIYGCWSDEKYGVNNKDVFVVYSDDEGNNWTEPILVTYRPNHKNQFMPAMAVDKNGYVNIFYYDQQNSFDNTLTDLYLAQSKNGGLKFDYYHVNTKPFLFTADHYREINNSEPVKLMWQEGDHKIYAATLENNLLLEYNAKNATGELTMARTFKFADKVSINFELPLNGAVTAVITKPLEPGFEKVIVKNKLCKKGTNTLVVDTKAAGLKSGNYTVTLYYNNRNSFTWIIADE